MCVACVWPDIKLFVLYLLQPIFAWMRRTYRAAGFITRDLHRRAFTLLRLLAFFSRERERDIQYRRKLSIITRNIRIVWTGRFILSYVWKPILKRFVSIQYSRHYMHLIGMAALFVIVDIRALQTVRYRYIRFQVFHECSNWLGCDTGRDSNRWKHCMPIFYLEIENFLEKFLKYDWIRINRININTLIDQLYQYVTNDNITYSNYSSYYQIFRTNFKLPWLPITSLTISKILNSQLHQISN